MSYEAMHKVRASGLTDRTQVDVLEALAFFHNGKTGACFPSTEAIARISRVNDRTVRLTLKVLHDLEFISSVQMPGQKRYFTLHLDRLPTSEAQQEPAPLQEITGGEEPAPLKEITGEGCKKLQGTPVKTYRGPLQKLTPEQVNEQVIACPRKRRGKPTILPTTVKRSKSRRRQEPSQRQAAHSRLTIPSRLNTLSTHKQSIQASTLRRSSPSSSTSTSRRTTSSAIGWPPGERGRRKQKSSPRAGRRASHTHHATTSRSSLMKPTTETGVFNGFEGNVFSTG